MDNRRKAQAPCPLAYGFRSFWRKI